MDLTRMIKTSKEISDAYRRTLLEEDELVLALRSEIGLVKIVDAYLAGANITRGLARISPKRGFVQPRFMYWALQAPEFKRDLLRRVGGSALQEISLTELRKIPAQLPPLPEQKKIAGILSTWDEAIETAEKLIENSKAQKKALMQQLLTGKRRLPGFEGEWRTYKLGKLFKERSERNRHDLPLLSITRDLGVINRDDVGRKDTSNADKSKYKRIAPGDIGYNTMRMWQGVSALSDKEGIVSPAYTIVSPRAGVSAEFMIYLFKLPRTVHDFYRFSQGLVSDTWNLKYPHFSQVKVAIPGEAEQIAIASVLRQSDKLIGRQNRHADLLQKEKKALMQQLLTGKRRVKVDEAA